MRRSLSKILVAVLAVVVMTLFSCKSRTVYNHFEHTPLEGWEKNDTLFFDVCPIREGGQYREELGLRIDGHYPFMSLQLTVEQTVLPMGHLQHDTLNCSLVSHGGQPKGDGISNYQYSFRLSSMVLNKGDSLHICVRHNMKRELLKGIADIGIKLVKE